MKRSGLTLLETVLTVTLLSILLSSMFRLNEARRDTLNAIKANTFALYATESLKNKVLCLKDQGKISLENGTDISAGVFDSKNWQLTSEATSSVGGDVLKLTLQNLRSPQKREFILEVPLSK